MADLIGASKGPVPTAPAKSGTRDFKAVYGYSYPQELDQAKYISPVINVFDSQGDGDAAVYTGYKFSGLLQKFLLDYAIKVRSGVPLSDEVRQDVNRPI